MSLKKQRNKGISSVFGSILILILVLTLASLLFLSLYTYEQKAEESIKLEEERAQEKIVLLSLSTEDSGGAEYLKALFINNTGTITSRIRAIYIDNNWICDPSTENLNQNDTYISPKTSLWINLRPANQIYSPFSKIEAATERGMKAVEYEWKLRESNQTQPSSTVMRPYYGPLLLDFDKFYYTEAPDGQYDSNKWKPGWSVEKGIEVAWNITVTNIDDRDITLNITSAFTLVPNAEGAQKPWFIELPNGMDTILIPSNITNPGNGTVSLIYIWDTPEGDDAQSVYNSPPNKPDKCRVFLSFFGNFHEKDGSTKPYGQTIPFEAVLVREPLIGGISDSPDPIAAGSNMYSTITVTGVRDVMGEIASGVAVNFTVTGDTGATLSDQTPTNSAGTATARLHPGTTPGTATVTVSWQGVSKSTTVTIAYGTLSLVANPTVVAVGSTTSTITATLTFNGAPLSGETVTFSASGLGTLSATSNTTNAQGQTTTTFTPGSTTGTATITATALTGMVTQTTQIHIINSITVSPSADTRTAGESIVYTATGSDGQGNSWDITNIVTWGIDSGAGGLWNGATYTSQNAGTWTVQATLGAYQDTATLTVNYASATSITVTPPTATATAGQSQDYNATAFDTYGNSWDVSSSVTWSIDQSGDGGSWVQPTGTYTSSKSGTWTVRAILGAVSGTSSLTVNPATLNYITLAPSSATVTAGTTQAFTAEAFDTYGNSLGDVTSSTTWSIDGGAGGSWAGATYTSQFAGIWTVTATYSGVSDTASLTVNHASANSLSILPLSANITVGQPQSYTATASDSFGNTWDATGSATWGIDAGAGGSWNEATYTSGNAGDWNVTATLGGVSGTSSLHVM